MGKIKNNICIIALIAALTFALVVTISDNKSMEKKWKESVENVKSYSEQFNNAENKNRAFKFTIEQLKYSQDSIFQELNKTRNELKIKDSKLQSMQYVSSVFTKKDTIILKDTIFRNPYLDMDTLLSDDWYSVRVGLTYPSTITVKPTFKSTKHIIVSSKRETVNPPSKVFFIRWFQKRQTILNIDVLEKNPYMQEQNNRYVEILK